MRPIVLIAVLSCSACGARGPVVDVLTEPAEVPASAKVRYAEALLAVERGDDAARIRAIAWMLRLDPSLAARVRAAELHRIAGDLDAAERVLGEPVEDPAWRATHAAIALDQGEDGAVERWAAELSPDDPAWAELARSAAAAGVLERAASRWQPTSPTARGERAAVLASLGAAPQLWAADAEVHARAHPSPWALSRWVQGAAATCTIGRPWRWVARRPGLDGAWMEAIAALEAATAEACAVPAVVDPPVSCEAKQALQGSFDANPRDPATLVGLAEAYLDCDEPDQAAECVGWALGVTSGGSLAARLSAVRETLAELR